MEILTKKCEGECGLEKVLSEFGIDKYTKDGYRSKCKECRKIPKEVLEKGYKRCTGECGEIKPSFEFHNRNTNIGIVSRCKKCLSTAKPKEILPEGFKRC